MATLRQRVWARLLHCYPLASGCGTLANHGLVQSLAGRSNELVWARTPQGRLRCSLADYVGRAAFYMGDLDPKISWIVRRMVNPGDVALDIGANLGLVTLLLAQRVGPGGQVFAFEPNPAVASLLEQSLIDNRLDWVTLKKIGLGSREGELQLSIPSDNAGAASFVRTSAGQRTVSVPVRTLSAVAAEHGIEQIDFIKMDVEGFEADVMRGAEELFTRVRPRAVLFELNDPGADPASHEVVRRLADAGYGFFSMPRCLWRVRLKPYDPRRDPPPDCNDFLAVPMDDYPRVSRLMRCPV